MDGRNPNRKIFKGNQKKLTHETQKAWKFMCKNLMQDAEILI